MTQCSSTGVTGKSGLPHGEGSMGCLACGGGFQPLLTTAIQCRKPQVPCGAGAGCWPPASP